jgi:hypothetical protein
MYRWKLTSFVIFSSLFWTISMGSAGLTWFILSSVLQPVPTQEVKEESAESVKDEPEDDEPLSEPVKVKQEEPESLLQSYPPAGDAGQGSGLESAEARGVQKRRSHSTTDV